MLVLLLSVPAIVRAQQVAIGEYPVPTSGSNPVYITVGPDGALWFTEAVGDKIGRMTTAGVINEYPLPYNTSPFGITAGPDGALWFTATSGWIGRITIAGAITKYPIPTVPSYPGSIVTGPDGALWFTEGAPGTYPGGPNQIGCITTGGSITEYPIPIAGGEPVDITAGPDGALWFTESSLYATVDIGRITTTGAITAYRIPAGPGGITSGPDGALWFTAGDHIGRITTAGVFTEYPTPTALGSATEITAGPDGALWFTAGDHIGRITTAGVISGYPVPTEGTTALGITSGPDGALWFAERVDRIGEVVFGTAGLSVTPASALYQANLIFTGTSFAPNENVKVYAFGIGSRVLASATSDASGSFTATALNPQAPHGPRLFLGVGQSSGKLGAAPFSVRARVILSPNAGTVGSTVVASGTGFGSLERVNIYWNNASGWVGTTMTDVYGSFSGDSAISFTIPAGVPLGTNEVWGKGVDFNLWPFRISMGKASFTVQ
jgi:virginiamycin B lyase